MSCIIDIDRIYGSYEEEQAVHNNNLTLTFYHQKWTLVPNLKKCTQGTLEISRSKE